MKAIIIPAVAVALCCNAGDIAAQTKTKSRKAPITRSEETIVIKKNNNGGNTTVEIRNGDVYVNGEKVAHANTGANSNQKIIIEDNGSDKAAPEISLFEDENMPRKAMLGVYTNTNKDTKGAEIRDVMPGSAADEAGLKHGDVITRIDGQNVADGKELTDIISKHQPGDKVTINYNRNGKEKQTEAALSKPEPMTGMRHFRFNPFENGPEMQQLPNPMVRPFSFDANDGWDNSPKMGIQVEDLADGKGVRVLNVKPNSPAAEAGLQKDDIIKKLDNEKVNSIDDLQAMVQDAKRNENIPLQYERDGRNESTEIYFPKPTRKKNL